MIVLNMLSSAVCVCVCVCVCVWVCVCVCVCLCGNIHQIFNKIIVSVWKFVKVICVASFCAQFGCLIWLIASEHHEIQFITVF